MPDRAPVTIGESTAPDNSPNPTLIPEESGEDDTQPITTQVEASTTEVPTTTSEAPTVVEISDEIPDYDMIDVHTGDTVNLRRVDKGDKPLLSWFWATLRTGVRFVPERPPPRR